MCGMTTNTFVISDLVVEKIVAYIAADVQAHSDSRPLAIEVVAQTGSTNADLMARLPCLTAPVCLVAEEQTAGRGRAGRSWLSEPGSALTFSLAWPFLQNPHALMGLPLAVGVALAQALATLDVPVQLKWPNDVLKDGKKLAGVLIETATVGTTTWAVIGVGLNLRMPDALEKKIGRPVADAPWLARMDRNRLLATLLVQIAATLEQFSVHGFAAFVEQWNRFHAHADKHVDIIDQGKIVQQGITLGVNGSGCLLLQDERGIWPVMAGDVSLRSTHQDLLGLLT